MDKIGILRCEVIQMLSIKVPLASFFNQTADSCSQIFGNHLHINYFVLSNTSMALSTK